MNADAAIPARHYGMDWLRIGAFALLILYHVAMVFSPWNFHIKSTHVAGWPTLPMLAVNAWRLTLLFVVSGYASRVLLMRSAGPAAFLRTRTARLLVPLAFGILVIVPPQPWAELVTKRGLGAPFLHFWWHDYFRFARFGGLVLPTWNHLWFVAYLWVYTILLVPIARVAAPLGAQARFDRLFGGGPAGGLALLVLPTLWLIAVHAWWFPMATETQALWGDWMAHAMYLPAFLFGVALARSPAAMASVARAWPVGATMALAGFAGVIALELAWRGVPAPPRWMYRLYGGAHAVQQWGAIVALIGIATRFWNVDRPIRATLTEAVFPFYIVHQTIIVVVMLWLLRAGLPGWAEFAILVAATVAGCVLFHRIGRTIAPLRPLIGLRRRASGPAPQPATPVTS